MKSKNELSKNGKWAIVVAMAVMHPVLIYLLYPVLGERCNLVIIAAPLLATWLFNWRSGVAFALVNTISTAMVFSYVAEEGPKEGQPKALIALIVLAIICFGLDRFKRFLDRSNSLKAELEEMRRSHRVKHK